MLPELIYILAGLVCLGLPSFWKPFIKGMVDTTGFNRVLFWSCCISVFLIIYPALLILGSVNSVLKGRKSKTTHDRKAGLYHSHIIGVEGHLFCKRCAYLTMVDRSLFEIQENNKRKLFSTHGKAMITILSNSNKVLISRINKNEHFQILCPQCNSSDVSYTPHYFT